MFFSLMMIQVVDVYNLSFDELKNNILQARRKHFLDDCVSPAFIKVRVIVSETRKHPIALVEANLAYAEAINSNVKFLMAENEKLENKLQAARQEVEQLWASMQNAVSTLGEMKTMILASINT